MSKVIGIDLGTTNSCVAILEAGEYIIIPNSEGGRTTPSVVTFEESGEVVVGDMAKRQLLIKPDRTVSSIKRSMGSVKKIKIDEKEYSPEEISAQILIKLKNDAESFLGEEIMDAIITVPAYFNDSQRQATKDAGKIAGLNVLRIINEPTAAALSYGIDKEETQKILIYDLGGGTFDISILELSNGIFEVLATSGNNMLGGDDFDKLLLDYLADEFYEKHKIDIRKHKAAYQRLRDASEKAKIELSSMKSTKISIPFIITDETGQKHIDRILKREELEKLIEPIVEDTITLLKNTIKDSKFDISEIDKILLVGGSTRIPYIQDKIKEVTMKDPYKGINPDECVAAGAAIQGGIIVGSVSDLLLLDVTPLSLGIETHGGVFTKLIERNTTIPTRKTQLFSTVVNSQVQVEIHVLQGEREMAINNKTLGRFLLTSIPEAPRGVPQIEVTFDIDVNGIVQVSAKDMASGNRQEMTITASTNLSDEEIRKAINDALKNEASDKERKEVIQLRNKGEKALLMLSTTINKYKAFLSEKDVSSLKDISERISVALENDVYKIEELILESHNTILNVSKSITISSETEE